MSLAKKQLSPEAVDMNLKLVSSPHLFRTHHPRQAELPIISGNSRFAKRVFDIGFSLLMIITFLWWVIPLLALLIKLTSRGPVFFTQVRTGRYNQPFTCYKLRSMHVNAEADKIQATANDPRITIAGRLLRKLSLDELPQFFNVLKGEMSVVGPRPHMTHHTQTYAALVEEYSKRLLVRPGITGLSQVEGYRGEIKERQILRNRVILDIFYMKHWSFWLDLKIIFKTIKLVLFGDQKAY